MLSSVASSCNSRSSTAKTLLKIASSIFDKQQFDDVFALPRAVRGGKHDLLAGTVGLEMAGDFESAGRAGDVDYSARISAVDRREILPPLPAKIRKASSG